MIANDSLVGSNSISGTEAELLVTVNLVRSNGVSSATALVDITGTNTLVGYGMVSCSAE